MNWKELSSQTLFTMSGTKVTPLSFFTFFLAIVASFAVSWVLQRVLGKALANTFKKKPGALATLLRLVHYTVLLTGLGIGRRPSASTKFQSFFQGVHGGADMRPMLMGVTLDHRQSLMP